MSNFEGILGFDLCIEITGIASDGATPEYLYITTRDEVILDWVQLENNQGTLEILAGKVGISFNLVATNTELPTTTTN